MHSDPDVVAKPAEQSTASHVRRPESRLKSLFPFILLAAVTALVHYPVLVGQVPLNADTALRMSVYDSVRGQDWSREHAELGDLVTQFYPWRTYLSRSFHAGRIPLWNPHNQLGIPFVGNSLGAVFYPPHLLYALLPVPVAWTAIFVLRTFFAALFTWLLARRLGASTAAALTAAVAFSLCGQITAFQGFGQVDGTFWLPLLLLMVERLRERSDLRTIVLTGITFALPALSGALEAAFHVTLMACAWALFRLVWPDRRVNPSPAMRYVIAFCACGVVAASLSMVQILPTTEWLGQTARTLGGAPLPHRPLPEIVTFFSRDLGHRLSSAGVKVPEGAAYVGILTVLLAPLALVGRDRKTPLFLIGTLFVVLQITYGLWPFSPLVEITPVFKSLANWRLLVVADLCLALLAALGLTALEKRVAPGDQGSTLAALAGLAAGVLVVALGLLLLWMRESESPLQVSAMQGFWSAALLATGGVIAIALALRRTLRPGVVGAVVTVALIADMASAAVTYVPFFRPEMIFPEAPVFDFLKSRAEGESRVIAVDGAWVGSFETQYGLNGAAGYTIPLRRPAQVLRSFCTSTGNLGALSEKLINKKHLLDLLNVRYLVATTRNKGAGRLKGQSGRFVEVFRSGSNVIFENPHALGKAFLVPSEGVEHVTDPKLSLARVLSDGFDPRRSAVVESPLKPAPGAAAATGPPGVTTRTCEPERCSFTVEAVTPSLLVWSETWYPGWDVAVNGQERPLLRADHALMGVALGPGTHEVTFSFRPMTFRVGLTVSLVTALLAIAVLSFPVFRRSRWMNGTYPESEQPLQDARVAGRRDDASPTRQ